MLSTWPTIPIKTLIILSAAFVAGCVSGPPTERELANADYGSYPTQECAESAARRFLESHLKDPDSAIYKWKTVATGWARDPVINGGKINFGYLLEGKINAKNSFGGYVGFKDYRFVIRDCKLTAAYGPKDFGNSEVTGKIY